jgi:hypothetical protein
VAITPKLIETFMAGDHIALAVTLKWPPWLPSPIDVDEDDETPSTNDREARAMEVRRAIIAELSPAQRRRLVYTRRV